MSSRLSLRAGPLEQVSSNLPTAWRFTRNIFMMSMNGLGVLYEDVESQHTFSFAKLGQLSRS